MFSKSLLVLVFLWVSPLSWALDCDAEYAAHQTSDMALSYEEFDQSEGRGFRALAGRGCYQQAADLIQDYIQHTQAKQPSLRWHIAQLRASAGQYEAAVVYARRSLLAEEDFSDNPLRWNDYVLATIAFLEHDMEGLIEHRDAVAEGIAEAKGNEVNLRLLDALIQNFDQDYATATRVLP